MASIDESFLGNVFTLALYVYFEYSYSGMLEVQLIFGISVIATILIGLVHEEKNIFYERSMYDDLTGLSNMRLFKSVSNSMLKNAQRRKEMGAMLFIDIDGFKQVNDNYGHHIGDAVLKDVAQILKDSLRSSDLVARFGGDEFVIQLNSNVSKENAEQVAASIVRKIQNAGFVGVPVGVISVSIGMAIYKDAKNDIDALIKEADNAMYCAKQRGKNRFAYADSTF